MAPRDSLFRHLQHLDEAVTAERQAARRKRQQQSGGEILQTFLAYRLDDAAEKMTLGIAIGDPLTLLHEPTNPWDANAVQVFWKELWIGYIPKDMAALIATEVPEATTGLQAVVTGLTTTSRCDAFRLQIAIPIPKASHRLRELGVASAFAWDFDRTSGTDKLRLVVSCSETAFRELQDLLATGYDVGKCGYSYYPSQHGRHYPWYLSLTEAGGRAPKNRADVEQRIRSHFGQPSESTRISERQERLDALEEEQKDINQRLETSRAEQRRLRREVEQSRSSLQRRADQAVAQGNEAIELAAGVEAELREKLQLSQQELDLALAENHTLEEQLKQACNEVESLRLGLEYLQSCGSSSADPASFVPRSSPVDEAPEQHQARRLWNGLRAMARRQALSWGINCSNCSGCWPPPSTNRNIRGLLIASRDRSSARAMPQRNRPRFSPIQGQGVNAPSPTTAAPSRCGSISRSAAKTRPTAH